MVLTMSRESQNIVLIVEDVEEWQQHIAAVVREIVGPDMQIQFAQNATEAYAVISTVDETRQEIALVLSDIHMSAAAENDDNGDVLLSRLMEGGDHIPPFAFVSGTLVERYQRDLASRIPGIVFLDKDAFLPMKTGTPERKALETTLRTILAQEHSTIPRDQAYLDILKRMKDELLNVAQLDVFIDKIKARIGTIWGKYSTFFESRGDAVEFLKTPDLYGKGDDPRKLHTFKNTLSLFIDSLYDADDTPSGLLDELIGLQVYINQVWSRAGEDKQMDVVGGMSSVCKNFGTFMPGRIDFSSDADEYGAAIGTVEGVFVLVEALQNALLNSAGQEKVSVHFDANGKLTIRNKTSKPLEFGIVDNEIQGGITESSLAGSGTGLRMIIEIAMRQGLKLNMRQEEDFVVTEIDFSDAKAAPAERDEDENGDGGRPAVPSAPAEAADVISELPNIVFIDHDGNPERTFEGVVGDKGIFENPVRGAVHHEVRFSRYGLRENLEAQRAVLENASLCIVHASPGELMNPILPLLHELYPHLVVLPASSTPHAEGLSREVGFARQPGSTDKVHENVLILDDILPRLHEDEKDLEEYIRRGLYGKYYMPEVWNVLVRIVNEIAVEKKRALESRTS